MKHTASLLLRAALLAATLVASPVGAQTPTPAARPVRGTVRSPDGAPIVGANVFILETLDGMLTGPDGRFSVAVNLPGSVTLVVKRLAFESVQRVIAPSERDSVTVVLRPGSVLLTPITVQAGAYTAGEERGATLTPLEVVTTPGTAADINRTIQTLPGVQSVDEGTALFVRGGDYTETKIFLNEAPLLNPLQLLSPSGTFVGTVDPFLLDGIFFSSGGFSARYGDALSAVAGLRTRGQAQRNTGTLGAGLAAFSADLGMKASPTLSIRAAANRFDLQPFLDVNGSPRQFNPAPHGRDLSGSIIWNYREGAELKLFAVDQTNIVGVGVDDPAFSGSYNSDVASRHTVLNWRDIFGALSLSMSASESRLDRTEAYGVFRLDGDQIQRQLFAQGEWQATGDAVLRVGGELERLTSAITGSLPKFGPDVRPGARTTLIALDKAGQRTGAFVELDWRAGNHWRIIPGVRADRSTLTNGATIDPRLNIAYRVGDLAVLTGAVGVYHQVPDPLFFDDSVGISSLPSMRATQSVVGFQLGEGDVVLRVEAYHKRYRNLAQQTRDHLAVAGGTGSARGVDLFMKTPPLFGFTGRSTMSFVSARRTDPNTGQLARAPHDVSVSRTWVIERAFASGTRVGAAFRSATGRPFTPVTSAHFDPAQDLYIPQYGAAMSERLPDFRRIDLSFSQYTAFRPGWSGVFYVSLSNALDRENVYAYRYSRDYSERIPVRSIFNRAVYVGASLIHQ